MSQGTRQPLLRRRHGKWGFGGNPGLWSLHLHVGSNPYSTVFILTSSPTPRTRSLNKFSLVSVFQPPKMVQVSKQLCDSVSQIGCFCRSGKTLWVHTVQLLWLEKSLASFSAAGCQNSNYKSGMEIIFCGGRFVLLSLSLSMKSLKCCASQSLKRTRQKCFPNCLDLTQKAFFADIFVSFSVTFYKN